ncbi:MAG: hypothetical protein Q7S27_06070 [Nanoarchaeota archaeon]|nr:hypothetical protein [Nanoarchaeota archaeon]
MDPRSCVSATHHGNNYHGYCADESERQPRKLIEIQTSLIKSYRIL